MLFSSYCKHAPNFVLQIHVILVSVTVVQILRACPEVMVIMNVLVIQASLEMEKPGVLVSITRCLWIVLFCCNFVSQARPTQAKLDESSKLCPTTTSFSVVQSHCSIIHMTRHTTDNSKKPGHLFH